MQDGLSCECIHGAGECLVVSSQSGSRMLLGVMISPGTPPSPGCVLGSWRFLRARSLEPQTENHRLTRTTLL